LDKTGTKLTAGPMVGQDWDTTAGRAYGRTRLGHNCRPMVGQDWDMSHDCRHMAGQDWDTTASLWPDKTADLWPNKTARQNYLQNYLQNYGRTRLPAGHSVSMRRDANRREY
jgi:hypothetical protein